MFNPASSSSSKVTHFSTLSSYSVSIRVLELFEKLNVKLCLVPIDPFSKKPSRAGWTDPDYNDLNYSWARHQGNVGILPGRSNLIIIDCDNEETANYFTKLAEEIDLSIDTLIVQTRRGKHFYYYCSFSHELEKKQFSNHNLKLDILAGNKCQVVAPYSVLKLDTNGNILDPKATDFILFEYTPVNITQVLAEITREKYEKLLEKLENSTQKSKKVLQLPPYSEIKTVKTDSKERELTDEEIEKIREIVEPYFTEGQRQNLILYLAGYLRKELNISEESVLKLYEHLQPTDDPKDRKDRIAAIKKTFEKDLTNITGKTGLIEVLGEETAKELCKKIEQALGIKTKKKKELINEKIIDEEFLEQQKDQNNQLEQQKDQNNQTGTPDKLVYIEINRKSRKYARCNYKTLTIESGAFEKNDFTEQYHFVVHYKVLDCCIGKIYAIENPLTKEKKYEVHFISKNPEETYTVLKGTIQDIWEELKAKTSYILNSSTGSNILTVVFSHYLKQNWYEKKQEELPPGFYYINNKFIASGFEEKEYTKEDLQKAALFLNEYIYSHPNPNLIASIIQASILLPFAFAQKQLVLSGKLRKRMKYIFLTGETKSGKTTTALLLACMWNQNDQIPKRISYASFNTEARAGKYLSNSTHILIVDEVSKDLEISNVKELLKYAQEDLIARTIQSKALKQIHYPALASLIMTSNTHFPEDPALLERFLVFKFRKTDKISADKRTRFEREDFRILSPLSTFIWQYVKKHGLRDDYIEYATEILKAFYNTAEIEAKWLDWKFIHDTAETEEEQQYTKEAEFYNAVIKFFSQNVKPREGLTLAKSIYSALKEQQFGRWIWIDDKNYVYISRDFLQELKKTRCNIRDLEELASITNWKRKKKLVEYSTIWVVYTSAEDFFFRLGYIPQPLSSTEFKQWLTGKLEVKHPEETEEPEELEEFYKG